MELDNKKVIDIINKEIDDYNGFAKGFHEDINEWKQSSKTKNKKLSDEEKDFETDTSNQIRIRSIKDLSPYLVVRLNKSDGSGGNERDPSNFFVFLASIYSSIMIVLVSMVLVVGVKYYGRDPDEVSGRFAFNYLVICLSMIFLIYEFALIFSAYHHNVHKKKKWIYTNIKAHILTYYYDQKNFNGEKWQIDRDTFLNNMKYIGRFNLLAIRLTEIGKDPTPKEWWKLVKLYNRYCFFIDSYFSDWHCSKSLQKKVPKVTRDPIKSPIKYIQYKLFFSIAIFTAISIIFDIGGIESIIAAPDNYFWPGCIFLLAFSIFLNLTFIVWAVIFVLRLQSNYNKVLSAIKPLFPNDVYEDFVNLTKNGIKNRWIPSTWFIDRVKRVDKNDKWR